MRPPFAHLFYSMSQTQIESRSQVQAKPPNTVIDWQSFEATAEWQHRASLSGASSTHSHLLKSRISTKGSSLRLEWPPMATIPWGRATKVKLLRCLFMCGTDSQHFFCQLQRQQLLTTLLDAFTPPATQMNPSYPRQHPKSSRVCTILGNFVTCSSFSPNSHLSKVLSDFSCLPPIIQRASSLDRHPKETLGCGIEY